MLSPNWFLLLGGLCVTLPEAISRYQEDLMIDGFDVGLYRKNIRDGSRRVTQNLARGIKAESSLKGIGGSQRFGESQGIGGFGGFRGDPNTEDDDWKQPPSVEQFSRNSKKNDTDLEIFIAPPVGQFSRSYFRRGKADWKQPPVEQFRRNSKKNDTDLEIFIAPPVGQFSRAYFGRGKPDATNNDIRVATPVGQFRRNRENQWYNDDRSLRSGKEGRRSARPHKRRQKEKRKREKGKKTDEICMEGVPDFLKSDECKSATKAVRRKNRLDFERDDDMYAKVNPNDIKMKYDQKPGPQLHPRVKDPEVDDSGERSDEGNSSYLLHLLVRAYRVMRAAGITNLLPRLNHEQAPEVQHNDMMIHDETN